jgi:hypothetical protein
VYSPWRFEVTWDGMLQALKSQSKISINHKWCLSRSLELLFSGNTLQHDKNNATPLFPRASWSSWMSVQLEAFPHPAQSKKNTVAKQSLTNLGYAPLVL